MSKGEVFRVMALRAEGDEEAFDKLFDKQFHQRSSPPPPPPPPAVFCWTGAASARGQGGSTAGRSVMSPVLASAARAKADDLVAAA